MELDLGENQSVTPCEVWVDDHNTTAHNWSLEIETEFLDLCVGPQRLDNYQLDKSNLFGCLAAGFLLIFSIPSQWFISLWD